MEVTEFRTVISSSAKDTTGQEEGEVSKSQIMVIAAALVMVAGGSLGSAPDRNASDLGGMLLLAGTILFIVSSIAMLRK